MTNSTPPAELARCYRSGEELYFRIGKAQDLDAIVAVLSEQIPASDRYFNVVSEEWQVNERYTSILENLFVNFPVVLRGQSGAYVPLGNSPHNMVRRYAKAQSTARARAQMPTGDEKPPFKWMSLLGYIGIALVCLALWPWLAEGNNDLLRLNGVNQAESSESVNTQGATDPETIAQPILAATPTQVNIRAVSVTVAQTANLRAGPGTNYEIRGLLEVGATINIVGQAVAAESFPWYQLDNGLWIYSPLINETNQELPQVDFP